MGQIFKILETCRDEEIGVVKKQVTCEGKSFCFDSPVVSQRANNIDPTIQIHEVIRHIDDTVVNSLVSNHIKPFADTAKDEFAAGKLNTTIFDLKYNYFPSDDFIKVIAHALYGASDKVVFLPAVKKSLLLGQKPGLKTPSFNKDKIDAYIKMMKLIVEETKMFKNGKEIIGMVPFIPFKWVRQIVDSYASLGIRAFAIDANFKDIMSNEEDFTLILSKIKESVPLDKTLIFAFNAGIPPYETTEIVSDDFLSVFAYVDVLGSTFKQRGGGKGKLPRAKVFSRDKYAYAISYYADLKPKFGKNMTVATLRNYNKSEQLKETAKVRDLIGVEKMKKYLATKSAVKQSMKHLESIAQKIG